MFCTLFSSLDTNILLEMSAQVRDFSHQLSNIVYNLCCRIQIKRLIKLMIWCDDIFLVAWSGWEILSMYLCVGKQENGIGTVRVWVTPWYMWRLVDVEIKEESCWGQHKYNVLLIVWWYLKRLEQFCLLGEIIGGSLQSY